MGESYLQYISIQNQWSYCFENENRTDGSFMNQATKADLFVDAIIHFRRPEIIRLLNEDPNLINARNSDGKTSLIAALSQTENFEKPITFLLAKHADVTSKEYGCNALEYMINKNSEELTNLFMKTISNMKFENGTWNIIHYTVKHKKKIPLEIFLNKLPHDILFLQNDMGNSIIHMAVMLRDVQMLELILSKAESIDIKTENKNHFNPIFQAVISEDIEILKCLLRFFKDSVYSTFSETGEYILQFACRFKLDNFLMEMIELDMIPITNEIDQKYGMTILHWAVIRNNRPLINVLLKQKSDLVNIADKFGFTPLGHVAQMFKVNGCDIESTIKIGADLIKHGAILSLVKNQKDLNMFIRYIFEKKFQTD